MGGLPPGMMEELVAQRQADLARHARGAGRIGRAGGSAPPPGERTAAHARGRRPLSRGVGRLLVTAGLRLAGPDALRGRVVLADGSS
jgi:hypothetical protein